MVGSTPRMVWKQPFMLSVTMSSNSCGVVSTPVLPIGPEPPATLTRMSMRPKASLVACAACSHCTGLVRSQGTMIASPPAVFAFAATGSIAAVSRPTKARRAPSAANAMVMAAPIPLAGPVITATRPLSIKSMVASSLFPASQRGLVPLTRAQVRGFGSRFSRERGTSIHLRLKQLLEQIVGRRQEGGREDLVDRRRARERCGIDQDVDRFLQSRGIDVAQPNLGDLGVIHLVLEGRLETLALDRNLDQRLT